MAVSENLARYWNTLQRVLFPSLQEDLGTLNEKHFQVIAILDVARIEELVDWYSESAPIGRPRSSRRAIARAFVAKAVLNLPTTRQLLDRLTVDAALRRLCGWERKGELPSESVFSRAFAEFAESKLAARVHESLVQRTLGEALVGHLSRDSTEIEGRERPAAKEEGKTKEKPQAAARKRGRPKRGEERPAAEPTRIEKQTTMTLEEMLRDLPTECNVGSKRNSKGFTESWIGYKLHIDAADGGIPVSCILTSASVHDSQVAIPLATISQQRVTNLYDLMDAAYDSPLIRAHSSSLGHKPIIDINPRRDTALKNELLEEERRLKLINFSLPEDVRFNERTTVERVNARIKDDFGARFVRVRGHAKVFSHLMFGVLALTASQILNLAR